MRCLGCNKLLTDFEATRKYGDGTYTDLCNKCWFNSDMFMTIPIKERQDLSQTTLPDETEGDKHAGHSD